MDLGLEDADLALFAGSKDSDPPPRKRHSGLEAGVAFALLSVRHL